MNHLFLRLVVAFSLSCVAVKGLPQPAHTRDLLSAPLELRRHDDSAGPASSLAFVDPPSATSAILETLSSLARQHPYGTSFSVAALKGGLADAVAQRSEQAQVGAKQILHDYRRTLVFILYGGFYQGMTLELLYNRLFNVWFGENVLAKLAFNQLVLTPFVTLPVAYVAKGVVFGNFLRQPGAIFKEYWHDIRYKGLLFTFWAIWTPVNFLLFSVIPPAWRITFSACVSFIWTVILSRIASAAKE
jgi:hypothetical protein